MKFSFVAWLRVLSLLFIPVGLLLMFAPLAGGKGFEVRPVEAIVLVFLGLMGNVLCGIAEK